MNNCNYKSTHRRAYQPLWWTITITLLPLGKMARVKIAH